MCSECGSVIPKLIDDSSSTQTNDNSPADFGIMTSTPETNQGSFGIEVAPPPPPPPPDADQPSSYPTNYTAYDAPYPTTPQKNICDRCGTVLRLDETQCPGCGKPHHSTTTPQPPQYSTPQSPGQPYTPPSPYAPKQDSMPYTPQQSTQTPSQKPKSTEDPSAKIAKCAKCGSIVYDYESRCGNCGRVLTPVSKKPKEPVQPISVPDGAARCGRCRSIVYPHQTSCPKCSKPLAPVSATRGPSQRISRCKRCSHTVYPTDTRCSNCGRKLDPVSN